MKRLLLLRHAKSDWSRPGLPDHDRPLNRRGLKAAPRMGRLLRELDLVPGLALVSTAVRARETARLALEAAGAPEDALRLLPDLYGASPGDILETVSEEGGSAGNLLVVAHNPGMEDLVAGFADGWEPFPTAALAVLSIRDGGWSDVSSRGVLENVYRPRELPRVP